jgi:exonuclease III
LRDRVFFGRPDLWDALWSTCAGTATGAILSLATKAKRPLNETFRLVGIYMPNLRAKIPYWEALIATLSLQSANRSLAIGNFNTCRAYLDEAEAIDATAQYMDAIEQIGFRDLWRHRYPDRREYSWFSRRNNGFRIDHAFLSQELAACAGTVHYSHQEWFAGFTAGQPSN